MKSCNPFSGRGAPVYGPRLVGRKNLLERLAERIYSEAHCSIVGLPRMGKTSVTREVLRSIDANMAGLTGGYVTLDAIRGPVQAYARILEETSSDEVGSDSITRSVDHDEAYESLLRSLRKRRRSGQRSVIIVDEMDAIVRDDFADAPLFVSRIREVANDRDRYGLTFIFVSRRSLDMIQGAVDCSTLAGLCEVIYLQPLEIDGLKDLAARSTIPVNTSGFEALWRLTGGHPFLAEVVMCEAVQGGETQLDKCSIENAQHSQAHEFLNQYRQLSGLLSHDGMFDALCELLVGPNWRQISPHAICLLKHYGILRSNDDVVGSVKGMSEHFKDYLTLFTRTAPSWVLLGDTERQLRNLIQDRMVGAYGDDWFEKLKQKHLSLGATLDKLIQQRSREKQMFGDAASEFLLDYAYISDLKDFIFAEWGKYQSVVGDAKADLERKFQDIIKVRNPMAHHRQVPEDVLQNAELSCKVLLSRLGGCLSPG